MLLNIIRRRLIVEAAAIVLFFAFLLVASQGMKDPQYQAREIAAANIDVQSAMLDMFDFKDKANGISMKSPGTWEWVKMAPKGILYKKGKYARISLFYDDCKPGSTTSDDAIKEYVDENGHFKGIMGSSEITTRSATTIDGRPATSIGFKGKEFYLIEEQGTLICIVNGTKKYYYLFFTYPEVFDTYNKLSDCMARSIKFL